MSAVNGVPLREEVVTIASTSGVFSRPSGRGRVERAAGEHWVEVSDQPYPRFCAKSSLSCSFTFFEVKLLLDVCSVHRTGVAIATHSCETWARHAASRRVGYQLEAGSHRVCLLQDWDHCRPHPLRCFSTRVVSGCVNLARKSAAPGAFDEMEITLEADAREVFDTNFKTSRVPRAPQRATGSLRDLRRAGSSAYLARAITAKFRYALAPHQ